MYPKKNSTKIGDPFSQLFPGGTVVKTLPANAGDPGDPGSIPGCGRCPREGNGNLPSILAWKIPRRERPGRLQPMGSQRVRHTERLSTHAFIPMLLVYSSVCDVHIVTFPRQSINLDSFR